MNKLLPSVKSLITLAALLCFLFQASAASAQKVSLSVRNATVKAAIERLQKDSATRSSSRRRMPM